MGIEIKKGNIDEVKAASDERIELTLLRKDFSEESFIRINLNNSVISKCVFQKTKFIVNEYSNCEFTSCDFTKADFLNVKFNNCVFHECKFNEASLQEVNFNQCSILTCSFENAKLENDVIGLNEKDMKIIHEGIGGHNPLDLTQIGFTKTDDNAFKICDQQDEIGLTVCLVVALEPEMSDETKDTYRIMFMVNDESVLSDTFDVTDENVDYDEIYSLANYILVSGKNKAIKLNIEDAEALKTSVEMIKSKLVFNSTEVIK